MTNMATISYMGVEIKFIRKDVGLLKEKFTSAEFPFLFIQRHGGEEYGQWELCIPHGRISDPVEAQAITTALTALLVIMKSLCAGDSSEAVVESFSAPTAEGVV